VRAGHLSLITHPADVAQVILSAVAAAAGSGAQASSARESVLKAAS
jgi:hypothetical protein